MTVFDIIGQNFFSVFSSKDRETNYLLLIRINELFNGGNEMNITIDKETLVNSLNDFWEVRNHIEVVGDDDEDISERSANEKTMAKIRLFKKCKWLDVEYEDFTELYSLNNGVDSIIKVLQNMELNDQKVIESTGYVRTTYKNLKDFDFTKDYVVLEQIYKNTQELMRDLQGLNNIIKRYISGLLKNEKITPAEIMENVLVKYHEQVVVKMFRNISTVDNPYKYSGKIIEVLELMLEYKNLENLTTNYLVVKNRGEEHDICVSINAENDIKKMIKYVIYQYKNMSSIIDEIDKRNTKYLKSARSKMDFIMNDTKDIEGSIINILRDIKDLDEERCVDIIELHSQQILSQNSFYVPRKKRTVIKCNESIIPDYDENEVDDAFQELFAENKYSMENINIFSNQLLNGMQTIKLQDMILTSDEDLFKVFLLQMYGLDDAAEYSIKYKDEIVSKNGNKIKDFEIAKGKYYYGI